MKKKIFIFVYFSLLLLPLIKAQNLTKESRSDIEKYLSAIVKSEVYAAPVKIDSSFIKDKKLKIYVNPSLSYISFTDSIVAAIYKQIKTYLPRQFDKYKLELYTDSYTIDEYIPFNRGDRFMSKTGKPLVSNISRPFLAKKGLANRHLALWQSHGWYYEQKLARWEWQRARVFQTVEDLYTQSYVLPYLVPMLENAGANVLLPRERDTQSHEIIVDNDNNTGQSIYRETNGKEKWNTGNGLGFNKYKDIYMDGDNPFKDGTYRQIQSTKNENETSTCEWIPDIPEKGKYAVYVSYKTLDNSADDVSYTVHHLGGETEFKVNQQMGGGTWIFLGFFSFDKGLNDDFKIVLTNKGSKNGKIITADAVKIGGGTGNIARMPNASGIVTENTKSSETITNNVKIIPKIDYKPEASGRPRYTEGARYWLQWAGMPDSIYSRSKGQNDYTDDYQSRGYWVNYIAGGSPVLPKNEGLNIPIDLAMAFHTDAGTTYNDSIIGTLGICMTHHNNKFANNKSRLHSRDLTDIIMNEVVADIRREFEPSWVRRHIWNRSYSEARTPEVPTMLLELLSHQNMADMRYGLDPRFQFTVSRSIYKGMLKFVANQYNYDYVVQPLPVSNFSVDFSDNNHVQLKWQPVTDISEPTAVPTKYIVYTRTDDGDFDNGFLVNETSVQLEISKDKLYSFKITAVNDGGESFPSEILSVYQNSQEKGRVLVVNGFDRLSAPFSFSTSDSIAGFVDKIDHGVPDKIQYNYIGSQYEFRRKIPWMDDDASGFGASNADYETTVIAGNTFDYPSVHGKSIAKAGYSFASCSAASVIDGEVNMDKYKLVDLILGKQKKTKSGRGAFPDRFKTFPKELQDKISDYCNNGGNIFASGAFIATDLWDTENPLTEDKEFANKVLRYKWRVGQAAVTGKAKTVASPFSVFDGQYDFYTQLNSNSYAAESPDALEPFGDDSYTVFRYSENNLSAGIVSDNNYKTCIIGFPFEVIKEEGQRDKLMSDILTFMFSEQ